ncbi:MAG: hypothetical protein ACJAUD_000720 [Crocinitomicaceae bacterium]|jgi:hypothetical protein
MKTPLLFYFILFNLNIGFGQNTAFLKKLKNSDSIVAISHKTLDKYRFNKCDSLGNFIPGQSLLKSDDINPDVIVKKFRLSTEQINELVFELSSEVKVSGVGACIDTHHSILMYSKGKLDYLDICFRCQNFTYSISSDKLAFSYLHWANLEFFMNSLGLIRKDLNYDGPIKLFDCRELR